MSRVCGHPVLTATSIALLLCAALCGEAPAAETDSDIRHVAERLRDRALAGSQAWRVLESLTTEIGARPVGSPAMVRARDWGVTTLKALSFEDVHVEEFVKENAWFRGVESAQVTAPYPHALAILGLGNGVPTPPQGIEAQIAMFSSFEDLSAAPPGTLADRIAVLNQPISVAQGEEGYRAAARGRRDGPSVAAARGAVGFLVRSLSTSDSRLPHAGATRYAEGAPRIPAAALGVPDVELLERLVARGQPVTVRMNLASTVIAKTPAWNVVGDLVGRGTSGEMIVIGGHLDSWDVSEGATDDGAGMAICLAAAHLIAQLPQRPRRTIRVVLWGSEETGGSGAAFTQAHRDEIPRLALASESDMGSGRIYRIAFSADAWNDPRLFELAAILAPLGILPKQEAATFAGTDVEDLRQAGVPIVRMSQDTRRYFATHHSADDTLNKVDRSDLEQNVAAWAAVLYVIAESGIDLRDTKARS
jgi:Peptidase family M28